MFFVFILTSKKFSQIPYYPTNKQDLPIILRLLSSSPRPLARQAYPIIDLGAGTGEIIFNRTTQKKIIGLESNPILYGILLLKLLLHANKKQIRLIYGDFFRFPPKHPYSIYIYPTPLLLERIKLYLEKFPKKTQIVTYMYKIPGWEKKLIKKIKGVNWIYLYEL